MASHEHVIWSPSAQSDIENVTDYLMHKWGVKVVERFLYRLRKLIKQISINPKQYLLIYSKLNIRKCVITKQNTLYYRIKDRQIEIIRIFDTRQDPGKLKILYS